MLPFWRRGWTAVALVVVGMLTQTNAQCSSGNTCCLGTFLGACDNVQNQTGTCCPPKTDCCLVDVSLFGNNKIGKYLCCKEDTVCIRGVLNAQSCVAIVKKHITFLFRDVLVTQWNSEADYSVKNGVLYAVGESNPASFGKVEVAPHSRGTLATITYKTTLTDNIIRAGLSTVQFQGDLLLNRKFEGPDIFLGSMHAGCADHLDCQDGEYCAADGRCKTCSSLVLGQCDAWDQQCCSSEFLQRCPANVMKCNTNRQCNYCCLQPQELCENLVSSDGSCCESAQHCCLQSGKTEAIAGNFRCCAGVQHCRLVHPENKVDGQKCEAAPSTETVTMAMQFRTTDGLGGSRLRRTLAVRFVLPVDDVAITDVSGTVVVAVLRSNKERSVSQLLEAVVDWRRRGLFLAPFEVLSADFEGAGECGACCLGPGKCQKLLKTDGSCCPQLSQCCQTGVASVPGAFKCCASPTTCERVNTSPLQNTCVEPVQSMCSSFFSCRECSAQGCVWNELNHKCSAICEVGQCASPSAPYTCPILPTDSVPTTSCKHRCGLSTRTQRGDPSASVGPRNTFCNCDEDCSRFQDCCDDYKDRCQIAGPVAKGLLFPVTFRYAASSDCNSANNCACSYQNVVPADAYSVTFKAFGECESTTHKGNVYYSAIEVAPFTSAYIINSYNDSICSGVIPGAVTISRAQLNSCIDGPKMCSCKYSLTESVDPANSLPSLMTNKALQLPILYQHVFGDACELPGVCGCSTSSTFPATGWAAFFHDLGVCTKATARGRTYYQTLTRRPDGLYTITSFSDSLCLKATEDTLVFSALDEGSCQDTSVPGIGRWRVRSQSIQFPLLFEWARLPVATPSFRSRISSDICSRDSSFPIGDTLRVKINGPGVCSEVRWQGERTFWTAVVNEDASYSVIKYKNANCRGVNACQTHQDCPKHHYCSHSGVCTACKEADVLCDAFDIELEGKLSCCSAAFQEACPSDPYNCKGRQTCKVQADCPYLEYCSSRGTCQPCGEVHPYQCDSPSGCCSTEFLGNCPSDPFNCKGQSCTKHSECQRDQYCNNRNQCAGCISYITADRCDSFDGDCCSPIFLNEMCPGNPYQCCISHKDCTQGRFCSSSRHCDSCKVFSTEPTCSAVFDKRGCCSAELVYNCGSDQCLVSKASCYRHSDCGLGKYCDSANVCKSCSLVSPFLPCDALSGNCCTDPEFLTKCPGDPHKCAETSECSSNIECAVGFFCNSEFKCTACDTRSVGTVLADYPGSLTAGARGTVDITEERGKFLLTYDLHGLVPGEQHQLTVRTGKQCTSHIAIGSPLLDPNGGNPWPVLTVIANNLGQASGRAFVDTGGLTDLSLISQVLTVYSTTGGKALGCGVIKSGAAGVAVSACDAWDKKCCSEKYKLSCPSVDYSFCVNTCNTHSDCSSGQVCSATHQCIACDTTGDCTNSVDRQCCTAEWAKQCGAPHEQCPATPGCSSHSDCPTESFCDVYRSCSSCLTAITASGACQAFDGKCCGEEFRWTCSRDPARCVERGVCSFHKDCEQGSYCNNQGQCASCGTPPKACNSHAAGNCCTPQFLEQCPNDPFSCALAKQYESCDRHSDCVTGQFCDRATRSCKGCNQAVKFLENGAVQCNAYDSHCCSYEFLQQCPADPASCYTSTNCRSHHSCGDHQYCGNFGYCYSCTRTESPSFQCDSFDGKCCTQAFAAKCPGDFFQCEDRFDFFKHDVMTCVDTGVTRTGRFRVTALDSHELDAKLIWSFAPEQPCQDGEVCSCSGDSYAVSTDRALTVAINEKLMGVCQELIHPNSGTAYFVKVEEQVGHEYSFALYQDRNCSTLLQEACTTKQEACSMPFTYKGVTYNECTGVDNAGVPWCKTRNTTDDQVVHVPCSDTPCSAGPFHFNWQDLGRCLSTAVPHGRFTVVRNELPFPLRWTWSPSLEECQRTPRKQRNSYFVALRELDRCHEIREVIRGTERVTSAFKLSELHNGTFKLLNHLGDNCGRPKPRSERIFDIGHLDTCLKDPATPRGYYKVSRVGLRLPLTLKWSTDCGEQCACNSGVRDLPGYHAKFAAWDTCTPAFRQQSVVYLMARLDSTGFYEVVRFTDKQCSRFAQVVVRFDATGVSQYHTNSCIRVPRGRVTLRQAP